MKLLKFIFICLLMILVSSLFMSFAIDGIELPTFEDIFNNDNNDNNEDIKIELSDYEIYF